MEQTAFIALYRGRSVGDARLIAVSSDREIVEKLSNELVGSGALSEWPEARQPLGEVPEHRGEEVESRQPPVTDSKTIRGVVRAEAYYSHIRTLPDAPTMREYGQILPSLPERIVSRMESETDHRHTLETCGQFIGAALSGGGLIGGVISILLGHDLAGVAIVASGVGPLVYGFVRSR